MATDQWLFFKKRNFLAILIGIVLAYPLSGCSKKEDSSHYGAPTATESTAAFTASSPMSADMANADMATASASSSNSKSASSPDGLRLGNNIVNQQQNNSAFSNKKLLVSAKADFQVKDVQQSANHIEALARQHGGYIANSDISNEDRGRKSYPIGNYQLKELISYSRRATMLVRIPKQQVGEFLQQLQQYIAFLDSSQFSAKDVTLEIQKAQVEAQIQAAKAAQISAQKADKTSQAGNLDIASQTALSRQEQLYADIQRQQLEDEVNLSTIELSFYQPEKIREQIVEDIDGKMQSEKSVNFLPRLTDNLKAGWLYLVEFLLFVSQFWSFILGGVLLWWLLRWFNRRKAYRPTLKTKISTNTPTTMTAEQQINDNPNTPTQKDDNTPQP